MARYWVYLNNEVAGPYGIDQLIRLRGFSRQTLVCVDEDSGNPKNWISPADIPELAHIFKAADEHMAEPAGSAPKAATKPRPRSNKPFVPAVTLRAPKRSLSQMLGWVLLAAALLGAGAFVWSIYAHRTGLTREQAEAQALVESVHLPAPSPYGSLPLYFQDKNIKPKWEFEKKQDGLYNVTLSWYAPALSVYAFEVNLQAQTVRGLNSAATKLLSEGFPAPPSAKAKAAPERKKSPAEVFNASLDEYRTALEGGDYQTVWNAFSSRKRAEMSKGGISQEGFIRLQGLTHRVETGVKVSVLKSKQDSDSAMLVLLKQTQDDRPDVFIKQLWVSENGTWKLDDEQKKSASAPASPPPPAPAAAPNPAAPTPEPAAASPPKPSPGSLPGMSN